MTDQERAREIVEAHTRRDDLDPTDDELTTLHRVMIAASPPPKEEVVRRVAAIYATHRWRQAPRMEGPLAALNPQQLREAMDAARAIIAGMGG